MNKNIEVSVYKGSETLLAASGIVKEIKAALQTKVNLPSGGYLFIQTTEALTVIDVNSGKFVSSSTQDETILKTNLEAVHEIARQLRLRNIGGMVIIDFIDMNNRRDKLAIMEEMELALEKDKAKPQVGQLSDLGLVELTRHRQGQSLEEIFGKKCPHCQGSGHIADEFVLSSPVAEGEIKAKAAKLKLPVHQIKNKTPNFKQNKVFSNPENNPLLNDTANQTEQIEQNNQNNQDSKFNNKHNKFNKYNKFNKQNQESVEQPLDIDVNKKQEDIQLEISEQIIEQNKEIIENKEIVQIEKQNDILENTEQKNEEVIDENIAPKTVDSKKESATKKSNRQPKQRGYARKSRKTAKIEETIAPNQGDNLGEMPSNDVIEQNKDTEVQAEVVESIEIKEEKPKKKPGRKPRKKKEESVVEVNV